MAWNPIPGIVENLLAEGIIAAFIGGGVLVFLKKRMSSWFVPLLWGLCGAVIILIGFGALRLIAIPLPDRSQSVTSDNAESIVVSWLDHFHLNVRNEPLDTTLFRRVVTP